MATRAQLHELVDVLPEDQVGLTLLVLKERLPDDPGARSRALMDALRRFHDLAETLPPFDALQAAAEARYELEERTLEP